MRTKDVTMVLVAMTIGLGGGYLAFRSSPAQSRELRQQAQQLEDIQRQLSQLSRPQLVVTQAQPPSTGQEPLTAAVEQAVRRVVDEREQANAPPEPKPPTAENMAAYSQANRVFADAVGAKRWTDSDNAQMTRLARQMGGNQLFELTQKFIVATNSGQVRVETSEPPLW